MSALIGSSPLTAKMPPGAVAGMVEEWQQSWVGLVRISSEQYSNPLQYSNPPGLISKENIFPSVYKIIVKLMFNSSQFTF